MSRCYLLHFEQPVEHAQHYIGTCDGSVYDRYQEHVTGQGSPLVREAIRAGILVSLVRTWPGGRAVEKQLKRMKQARRLCPLCRQEAMQRNAEKMQRVRQRKVALAAYMLAVSQRKPAETPS